MKPFSGMCKQVQFQCPLHLYGSSKHNSHLDRAAILSRFHHDILYCVPEPAQHHSFVKIFQEVAMQKNLVLGNQN
jgi:hypothetical protein